MTRYRRTAALAATLAVLAARQPNDGEPERRDPIKARNAAKRERRAKKKGKRK